MLNDKNLMKPSLMSSPKEGQRQGTGDACRKRKGSSVFRGKRGGSEGASTVEFSSARRWSDSGFLNAVCFVIVEPVMT